MFLLTQLQEGNKSIQQSSRFSTPDGMRASSLIKTQLHSVANPSPSHSLTNSVAAALLRVAFLTAIFHQFWGWRDSCITSALISKFWTERPNSVYKTHAWKMFLCHRSSFQIWIWKMICVVAHLSTKDMHHAWICRMFVDSSLTLRVPPVNWAWLRHYI